METHAEITIKKWIEKNPIRATALNRNDNTFAITLINMAIETGLSRLFIEQNLKTIRNWI